MHPAQQQGLRIPPRSFESAFLIRILLVSAFLPDVTQQIHSLRASGVISSHTARAAGIEIIARRKSAGSLCTTPVASAFLLITLFYQIFTTKHAPQKRDCFWGSAAVELLSAGRQVVPVKPTRSPL